MTGNNRPLKISFFVEDEVTSLKLLRENSIYSKPPHVGSCFLADC
jgi:hypothetical protein